MKKIIYVIIGIVILAGAFYGGMKYQESKTPAGLAGANFQNLRNLSPEERQQKFQELGANASGAAGRRGGSTNGAAGEIIAKDDKSITIKLRDAGSKIIFFSDTTEITKSASGSADDLEIGKNVMVGGKQNSDGSYTAETIQLSPSL